jgi:cell division transport system permease protein
MKHRRNNLGYYLREGVRGMFLHGFMSFAAICVIVACLIIMGSFCLILVNLNHMINELEQDNEILVYIDEDLSEAEAKSVGSQINMITNVLESDFVSREQALEEYIAEQDDPSLFSGVDSSTLRNRFRVTLVDITQMETTVSDIEQIQGVAKVSAHYEISRGFLTLQNILNLASAGIILVLLIVSLFIIANTVKLALYDRQEEIGIMKMVGATNGFVRGPFVIEGFLLGILGAGIAFAIEWGLYDLLSNRLAQVDTMKLLDLLPFSDLLYPMVIAFGATGFVVGVFGSLLSIRKFLKV